MGYGLFVVEVELFEIGLGGSSMRLSVFSLVLALFGDALECLDRLRGNGVIADEFVDVTRISAQVSPSEDLFAAFPALNAEMKGLVKKEGLFVTFCSKGGYLGVFTLLVGQQLGLAFFINTLNDQLVLKILASSSDAGGGVFEDEFGISLGGEWSNEIKLALRQFYHGFLIVAAKKELANCEFDVRDTLVG